MKKLIFLGVMLQLSLCVNAHAALADELAVNSSVSFVSVEDNLRNMDKNKDGMVTVYEVRAFIEAKHGKNYKKDVLDDMESSASGKSCSTPFAKSLYQ